MNSGIYRITSPSGKVYIGSAVNFRLRFNKHRTELRTQKHHCKPLQNAANKYGVDSLVFEKLILCSESNLLFYEQLLIDAFSPEYNMQRIAGSALGMKRSKETCKKLSEANKKWVRTPEVRAAMSAGRIGMKLSDEHKRRIGESQIGKKMSDEAKRKISEKNKGKRRTPEQIQQMSVSRKGRVPSDDERQKMVEGQRRRRAREAEAKNEKRTVSCLG